MPMKLLIVILIAATLTTSLILLVRRETKYTGVTLGNTKIKAEIADTPAERTKGLMFRKKLSENSGMLFVFPNEGKHSFWMLNTFIPLDIIWADSNKNIVHVERSVPLCTESIKSACKSYKPSKKARYVLEVSAGIFDRSGAKVGDKIFFKL